MALLVKFVALQHSSLNPYRDRDFYAAFEDLHSVFEPNLVISQRLVGLSFEEAGKRMAGRLYCSPILTSSQGYCVDSVEHAFIVRHSPEFVQLGELEYFHHPTSQLTARGRFPPHLRDWYRELSHSPSVHAKIAQNLSPSSSSSEFFH